MHIENKYLYDAMSSLTKVVLAVVTERFNNAPIYIPESTWVKQSDSTYVKQQKNRPLWSVMLHKANDEITKTKEYANFINVVSADDNISSHLNTLVGTKFGASRLEAIDLALSPVYEFLTDQGVNNFNTPEFNSIYQKIEKALFTNEIDFVNITPLCGFTMEDTEVSLSDNISIVRLSDKEVLGLFNLGFKLGGTIGGIDFAKDIHPYAIKISYKLPKVIGNWDRPAKDLNDNEFFHHKNEHSIIDAFRIFKQGNLYPITTVTRADTIFPAGVSFSFEKPVKQFVKNKYNLSKIELNDFKKFWTEKGKSQLSKKKFLSVAIRRFSQANERDSVEDEIIDLMISAEALFLSSGGSFSGELKYRLSHRAAMFIENNVEKQKYVFEFMQKAYDVRSSIVHGSEPKLSQKNDGSIYTNLEEFSSDIEKYLRISIKKAIAIVNESNGIDWDSIVFS